MQQGVAEKVEKLIPDMERKNQPMKDGKLLAPRAGTRISRVMLGEEEPLQILLRISLRERRQGTGTEIAEGIFFRSPFLSLFAARGRKLLDVMGA